ncbi:hypothetical protein SAMN03159341_11728 [Paenibacillus sp. 1_12]|nr:hypothetical protein SAMN03159341_11728 [Paenibacillus sp. 1_12]
MRVLSTSYSGFYINGEAVIGCEYPVDNNLMLNQFLDEMMNYVNNHVILSIGRIK